MNSSAPSLPARGHDSLTELSSPAGGGCPEDNRTMNSMSARAPIRYVIITPARDEAEYVEKTIASVVAQAIHPLEWLIVDDGSTDGTSEIIDRYAHEHSWIHPLHRTNRGFRHSASGVMEAFYDAFDALKTHDWDFLVKLDADLSFEPNYFEKCLAEFAKDRSLGIGGGVVRSVHGSITSLETAPDFHVRGATKIYRRECWDAIGGLLRTPGWDTVDELKANMLGWQTRSFSHLPIVQHRPTGGADGRWRDAVKNGRADYISGYHPLFMLVKCLKRTFQTPLFVSALGHAYGYLGAWLGGVPPVQDKALVRYVRKQQLRRLMLLSSLWK
jgi:biofilm PGA synthesis N-glycosyltransferase PgaC